MAHRLTPAEGAAEAPSDGALTHRVTGNQRDSVGGAGWEYLFVAVDNHSRVGFTDLYPDEGTSSAVHQGIKHLSPVSRLISLETTETTS